MRAAAVGAALFALLLPVTGAAPWAWLTDAATADFEDSDWQLLKDTTRSAFADAADGERRDWKNPQTGNGGAVKPLLTFPHEGRRCRRMAFLILSETAGRGVATYSLCRAGDGRLAYLSPSEHPR